MQLNNKKGAITVFLAIILSTVILLAGVLVDAARIYTASSIANEALEASSNSVLAGYDKIMKDMYEIFSLAKSNPENIKEELDEYLFKTLVAGVGADEKILQAQKSLNFFDFNIEDIKVTPNNNLIESDILKRQILQYMKYRAPKVWLEGFLDNINGFKGLKKQTEIIDKKINIDNSLNDIKKYNDELSKKIIIINEFKSQDNWFKEKIDEYNKTLLTKDKNKLNAITNEISSKIQSYKNIDIMSDINNIINKSKNINTSIDNLKNKDLKEDKSDFGNMMNDDLTLKKNKVGKVELSNTKNVFISNRQLLEQFNTEFSKTNQLVTEKIDKEYVSEIDSDYYFNNYLSKFKTIEGYAKSIVTSNKELDPRSETQKIIEQNSKDEIEKESNNIIKDFDAIKSELPSYNKNHQNLASLNIDYLEQQKNLDTSIDIFNKLENISDSAKDELFIDEYILGTFKDHLFEQEQNLRGLPKKKLDNTYFDKLEVEYILTGNANQSQSLAAIKAQILLIRFALNTLYIYMDRMKVSQAMTAAVAIAGWTGFGIPIVQNAILLSWAMAESCYDVKFLLEGKKMPLFKTSDTFMLGGGGLNDSLKSIISKESKNISTNISNKLKSYSTQKTEEISQNLLSIISSKIDMAIDKAFEPTYTLIDNINNYSEGLIESIDEQLDNSTNLTLNLTDDDEMNDILNDIISTVQGEANNSFSEIKQGIMSKSLDNKFEEIRDKINIKKESIKNKVLQKINPKIESLKTRISDFINNGIDSGNQKLQSYLDKFDGKQSEGVNLNLKNSIITLSYQDYLRIFLLMQNGNTKIARVQDLMQLNISKATKNNSFKLSSCFTSIDIEGTFSIKYLFLTKNLIPKAFKTNDGRQKLKCKVKKGYLDEK